MTQLQGEEKARFENQNHIRHVLEIIDESNFEKLQNFGFRKLFEKFKNGGKQESKFFKFVEKFSCMPRGHLFQYFDQKLCPVNESMAGKMSHTTKLETHLASRLNNHGTMTKMEDYNNKSNKRRNRYQLTTN